MPLNIFTGSTTANWSATSSWSLGRVPTATDLDTVYFGPISPTCSIDVTNAPCYNFDSSTYTRELVFNQNLRIFGTYSNFGGGTFRFTSTNNTLPGSLLRIEATCSVTSNNFIIPTGFIAFGLSNNSYTVTLLDGLTADNMYFDRTSGTPTITVNGSTMSVRTSFQVAGSLNLRGTSNIELRGTASSNTTTLNINSANPITNNVFVNSSGIVNIISMSFLSNNNQFRYIAGSLSITSLIVQPNNSTFTYNNILGTLVNATTFIVNSNNNMTFSSVYVLNTNTLTINGGPGGTTTTYNIYGGFSCSTFTSTNGNANTNLFILLNPTASYIINNNFNCNSFSNLTTTEIKSNTLTNLIVSYNATQSIFNTLFTNIDASGGATILPYQKTATFSNVTNIQDLKSWYIQTNQIQIN